jgi:CheY-like chemotaxis protein
MYSAKSGRRGLGLAKKLANKGKLDVILLDWLMPGMDGLKVLSKLKHNEITEQIPVFMLTEKSKIADIDRAYGIGVDAYITKPFKVIQIGGIIKRKLEKAMKMKNKQLMTLGTC